MKRLDALEEEAGQRVEKRAVACSHAHRQRTGKPVLDWLSSAIPEETPHAP